MSDFEPVSADVVEPPQSNGLATASLVLGLMSFFFCLLTGLPAIITGIFALQKSDRSQGRIGGRGLATTGIVLGSIGTVASCIAPALLLPAVQASREAARRMQSSNNLRMLGIGMHSYATAKNVFPAAGSETSKVPGQRLSWRVHLLPFLEENALYQEFHLDEPWDSPHNRTLIARMPQVYQSPNDAAGAAEGKTLYLAIRVPGEKHRFAKPFTGDDDLEVPTEESLEAEDAVHEPQGASFETALHSVDLRRLSDFRDGTSNTIFLVEADPDQAVIWTKPDDLVLDVRQPRRGLGNLRPNGFLALIADGSVHFFDNSIDDETLLNLFNINDGKLIPPEVLGY